MKTKILITGVSSGIGFGLAKAYLERGAEVYGLSRRCPEELVAKTAFHFCKADLSQIEQIKSAVTSLPLRDTVLNNVILNAGVAGPIGDVNEIELDEFLSVMNVNVWGNKILLDSLFATGVNIQQIVAISSHAGTNAFRGSAPYCVSKAALNMLIALYATERPDIHFSAIAPPLVDTEMQEYLTSQPSDPRFGSIDLLKFAKESGRMSSPESAAEILLKAFDTALSKPSGSFVDASVPAPNLFRRASNSLKKLTEAPVAS